MSYSAIADYLQIGYPKPRKSESLTGSTWLYRSIDSASSTTLNANIPEIGDAWADGLPVTSVEGPYQLQKSGIFEMLVESSISLSAGSTISSTLESSRYQIRWQPHDVSLMQHPEFLPGGTSDLNEVVDPMVSSTRTHRQDVIGWEMETDMSLKAQRKYKLRDSDGNSYGPAMGLGGQALAYVKLRELGYDSYSPRLPVWSKISRYRGTDIPGVGSIGLYEASPPGSPPSGFEWIKEGDDAERQGMKTVWDRVEVWQGYKKVYYDADTLNPAGHTLP